MSRKVTVMVGDKEKTYTINPLKGKHIRALINNKETAGFNETFAVVGYAGIPDKDVDEMDFRDVLKLHQEINAETFGSPDEQKN